MHELGTQKSILALDGLYIFIWIVNKLCLMKDTLPSNPRCSNSLSLVLNTRVTNLMTMTNPESLGMLSSYDTTSI